ncbi:MAG: hypothetical protein AAGA03_13400, partial [Planctomycetota bacterium]
MDVRPEVPFSQASRYRRHHRFHTVPLADRYFRKLPMRRRSPAWFFVFSLSVLSISGPPAWAHEVPGEAKHRHQHEG